MTYLRLRQHNLQVAICELQLKFCGLLRFALSGSKHVFMCKCANHNVVEFAPSKSQARYYVAQYGILCSVRINKIEIEQKETQGQEKRTDMCGRERERERARTGHMSLWTKTG